MKYLLLIHADETGMMRASEADQARTLGAYLAYTEALRTAGVFVATERLRPSGSSTTVRVTDAKTNVLDGPYADTKEQLGGFYMIEARDLNDAIQVAAKIPSARTGSIEVRPVEVFDVPAG